MEKSWKVKVRMVNTEFKNEDDEDSLERIIIGIPKTEENEEMIRQIFGKEIEIKLI